MIKGSAARIASVRELPALPGVGPDQGSRAFILSEALALFAEKGYGATTVRDIAARVGMKAGSLYSHFPSKEMMLAELVHLGHAQHGKCLRAAVLASAHGPRNQLIAFVRAHVLFHTTFPTLAVVSNAEMHVLDPALAKPTLELRDQNRQLLRDVIARGIEVGTFKVTNLDVASAVVAGAGLRVANWFSAEYHVTPEELAEQIAEIACRIVGAP